MQARPIINFRWTSSLVALLALFFVGCQTTAQKGATSAVKSPGRTEVPLAEVRQYLADFGFSERLQQEIFAEEFTAAELQSRTQEEISADVATIADARARVLSDISYYPTRRPVLEVAGALLAQEHLVLQILHYRAAPETEPIATKLAERLRDSRARHPELRGGAATALLAELSDEEAK